MLPCNVFVPKGIAMVSEIYDALLHVRWRACFFFLFSFFVCFQHLRICAQAERSAAARQSNARRLPMNTVGDYADDPTLYLSHVYARKTKKKKKKKKHTALSMDTPAHTLPRRLFDSRAAIDIALPRYLPAASPVVSPRAVRPSLAVGSLSGGALRGDAWRCECARRALCCAERTRRAPHTELPLAHRLPMRAGSLPSGLEFARPLCVFLARTPANTFFSRLLPPLFVCRQRRGCVAQAKAPSAATCSL